MICDTFVAAHHASLQIRHSHLLHPTYIKGQHCLSSLSNTIMSSVTVSHVANSVTPEKVEQFFAFCGHIDSVKALGADGDGFSKYQVCFSLEKALSTALLLNDAELDNVEIVVKEDTLPPYSETKEVSDTDKKIQLDAVATGDETYDDIAQEEKPKLAVLAQILASGYQVSDQVIDKAVEIDKRNGFSAKFTNFLNNLDLKFFHSEDPNSEVNKAQKELNNLSASVQQLKYLQALQNYFEKASSSPYGVKVHDFYKQVSKEVRDVHEEAKRLNALKAQSQQTPST